MLLALGKVGEEGLCELQEWRERDRKMCRLRDTMGIEPLRTWGCVTTGQSYCPCRPMSTVRNAYNGDTIVGTGPWKVKEGCLVL